MKFSGQAARRGVLSDEEAQRLFARTWQGERAQIGNELSMSTGLRSGEVLAIQVRDIDGGRLHVRHSWSNFDGLKATGTGEERTVPLVDGMGTALLELARKNPHGCGPTSYVFWSIDRADRPMDAHGLLDPLKAQLLRLTLSEVELRNPEKLKVAEAYWRSRRVCFHSWRHLYAARMADRLEQRKVQVATGHRSAEVFRVYADHASEAVLSEVSTVTQEAFGKLLPFQPRGRSLIGRVG